MLLRRDIASARSLIAHRRFQVPGCSIRSDGDGQGFAIHKPDGEKIEFDDWAELKRCVGKVTFVFDARGARGRLGKWRRTYRRGGERKSVTSDRRRKNE